MSDLAGCVKIQWPCDGQFQMISSFPPRAGASVHELSIDAPLNWADAVGAVNKVRVAIGESLANRAGTAQPAVYPLQSAREYLDRQGWVKGLEVLTNRLDRLPVQMGLDYKSAWLWPEIIPVQTEEHGTIWLDQLAPIHRTLEHLWTATPRRQEMSLAIIYGENDANFNFESEALILLDRLSGCFSRVDLYRGAEFKSAVEAGFELLEQVFHQHRAVVFLGHSQPAGPSVRGGWKLTHDHVLEMARLEQFFRPLGNARKRDPERGDHKTIPDIVFANCCFSAASDPDREGQAALSYPKMFLDAGVDSFIGTAMDVVMPRADPQAGLQFSCQLLYEFFNRWAVDPSNNPVRALYEAKRACGFDLFTSLYQIYRASSEQVHTPSERRPLGSLVSSVRARDELGPYELEKELWTDPWSRSFFAVRRGLNGQESGKVIVQILVDSLQMVEGLPERIGDTIDRLREAKLEHHPGLLIPSRCEKGKLKRQDQTCEALVVVYDRPSSESGDDWKPFDIATHRLKDAGDQDFVLRFAAQLSGLLVDMHERGISHGNLDPYSIAMLHRQGAYDVVLRNIWVCMAGLSRSTEIKYASPEELSGEAESGSAVKRDCWGLGVIIYEALVDGAPFDKEHPPEQGLTRSLPDLMGRKYALVPKALERIVHECLAPSAATRPDADFIHRRLRLALGGGGAYIGELESELDVRIQAGKRLYYVHTRDVDDVERLLNALAAHPHPNRSPDSWIGVPFLRYRLFVVEEYLGLGERPFPERGVTNRRFRRVLADWSELWASVETEMTQVFASRQLDSPGYDDVAEVVGEILLEQALKVVPDKDEIPVVLFRGNSWWNRGDHVGRLLRNVQSQAPRAPVIVIADDEPFRVNIDHSFELLRCPTPSPAELFERIRDFPRSEGFSPNPVDPSLAERLAHQLYGYSMAEVDLALRRCLLRHGGIDERLLELEDEIRRTESRQFHALDFQSLESLPIPTHFAIPQWLELSVARWALHARQPRMDQHVPTPQRLLIRAPHGCGKTTLARTLGALTDRVILRINVGGCVSDRLGESERMLRVVLGQANSVRRALVLLDDIHHFLNAGQGDQGRGGAALRRMESTLLHWLDDLPDSLAVICTVSSGLPADLAVRFAPWARRMQWTLELPKPTGGADEIVQYRSRVFSALFRRFQLQELAENEILMCDLARGTDPARRSSPLPSPLQRRFTSFAGHCSSLETGDEIEGWIKDTICLMASPQVPASQEAFWRAAIDA